MFLEDKGVTFWSFGLANRALTTPDTSVRSMLWRTVSN
jgi:hypothetical protein